jgi:hypothetical protein
MGLPRNSDALQICESIRETGRALLAESILQGDIWIGMERNYDEIIADLLKQVDQHSAELTEQSKKSDALHLELISRLKEHDTVHASHLELILHTATILDRIIKKNQLML